MTKLPKTWEVKTLGEVCESKNSNIILRNIENNEGIYPIYGAKGIIKYIDFYEKENECIGVVKDGSVGKVFLLPKQSSVIGTMHYLECNQEVYIKYLFYFLHTINFNQYISGSVIPHIYFRDYKKEKIPLPPIETQKQIVEILESKFAKIENATNALNLVKKDLVKLKASLLNSAFNGTLLQDNDLQALSHDDTASNLPRDWEVKTLGEVCEIITGSTPSKKNAEYYGNNYPFYKPTDLNNGYFVDSALDNVSLKGYEISRQLQSGSVLVTCIGATIGKTGLIRKEGICNQQINAILPSDNFLPEFMYFYCISPKFQELIKINASSTTLPILNKNNFAKLPIPLPPVKTQKQIVEILESKFKAIEKLDYFVNDSLDKLSKLKASLLNKAFSGELVC